MSKKVSTEYALSTVVGSIITILGVSAMGEHWYDAITLDYPFIDVTGDYALENEIICWVKFLIENGEILQRYVYYDVELEKWCLLEGWNID